jgi:hypothetical protein
MSESPDSTSVGSITWTPAKLKRFRKAYNECQTDQFTFEGFTFLKAYAAYLIEYLDGKLL